MSHLIQRMIQRTRASLPGIEPLLPPRYAQPPVSGPQSRADFGPEQTTEESTAGRYAAVTSMLPVSAATSIRSSSPPQFQDLPANATEPAGLQERAEIQARTIHQEEAGRAAVHAEAVNRRNADNQTAMQGAIAQALPIAMVQKSEPGLRNSEQPHDEIKPRSRAQKADAMIPGYPLRKPGFTQLPRPPEGEANSADSAGSITVSIGHIEVRAAQPMERPRRAAFRPRVSLSDFLSQRKGEHA